MTPHEATMSPLEHESGAAHTTCPPDDTRMYAAHDADSARHDSADEHADDHVVSRHPAPPPAEAHTKPAAADMDALTRDIPTPMTTTDDGTDDHRASQPSPLSTTAPASLPLAASQLTWPFPAQRFLPNSSSSLLRPGSRFRGSQTSDRQQYEVEVELQHVDMRESFMCGYLRIQGLTEDHPSLTTYFEGEIIGNKYTFITQHPEWGSNEKVDRQHWARFPAYKPLSKHSSRPELVTKDWTQREHLFMRWKEYFLVPDHRVRTINGASFEGFYYISFSQITGTIEGIYFHAKSEKFQRLQLEHVEDHGCQGAYEFR
jgi:hypothetical protein